MPHSLTYFRNEWSEGSGFENLSPNSHCIWMANGVFDGARFLYGSVPDLKLHIARLQRSAEILGLKACRTDDDISALCSEGLGRFSRHTQLYIRMQYFATEGAGICADAQSTEFALSFEFAPVPRYATGLRVTFSDLRRPDPRSAPTMAKAACLYPQSARALHQARLRGFDNAVVLDLEGNVAEFTSANIFFVKDGVVHTPRVNGTFLPGITRGRVLHLMEEENISFLEGAYTMPDILDADEIFLTSNYEQVQAVRCVDSKEFTSCHSSSLTSRIIALNSEYIRQRREYFPRKN